MTCFAKQSSPLASREEQGDGVVYDLVVPTAWAWHERFLMKTLLPETIHCMSPLLVVSDLGRSVHFYTEQLVFEIHFRHEAF